MERHRNKQGYILLSYVVLMSKPKRWRPFSEKEGNQKLKSKGSKEWLSS
jgi:hypothetical protein